MSPETRYRIEELEKLTGLSRRLIYDYISRDLVPPALGSGKGAYYIDEHFDRLRLISLLRTMGFRLERIEEALETWSEQDVSQIVEFAEGRDMESLDALNQWLTRPVVDPGEDVQGAAMRSARLPRRYRSDEALERMRAIADERTSSIDADRLAALSVDQMLTMADEESAAEPPDAAAARASAHPPELADTAPRPASAKAAEYAAAKLKAPGRPRRRAMLSRSREPEAAQTWHRVPITRNVEISYRSDAGAGVLRRVRELIAGAKELFDDGDNRDERDE